MIFFKHPRKIPKLQITINGNPVEQFTNFNFLCITIDQQLTWNDHPLRKSHMLPTCEPRVFHIKAHIFHIFSQNVINCPM